MDLSVIIPCFNVAETIGEQLDSLQAQHWDGDWEIIVVNNRSTDETSRIVRERMISDPRIRLIDALERPSASYARNVGILAARSEFIAGCDGDDIVAAGWVAAMGNALKENDIVTGKVELSQLNPSGMYSSRGKALDRVAEYFGIFAIVAGNNMGFHRTLWDAVGRFDESFQGAGTEDMEFSLRVWQYGKTIRYVPEAMVHYRYRKEPAALWRQGLAYGRGRVRISRRLRDLALTTPAAFAGWRSWLWLVRHLPDLLGADGRAAWVWVAGNRAGQLLGSLRWRIVQL